MSGRRFRYALEAVQLRARHALDEAMQKVADSRRELQAEQETRHRLLGEVAQLGSASAQTPGASLDPVRAMVRMHHLLTLRQRVSGLEQTIVARQESLSGAIEALKACQRDCEKFDRHHDQQLTLHRQAIAAREAVEADNAWLARPGCKQPRQSADDVEVMQ